MSSGEVYKTAEEARAPFGFSESGWRDAWRKGRVPAPVIIGGKYLWPQSRLEAFEREALEQAAAREAALKQANSPAARHAAELANSPAAQAAARMAEDAVAPRRGRRAAR